MKHNRLYTRACKLRLRVIAVLIFAIGSLSFPPSANAEVSVMPAKMINVSAPSCGKGFQVRYPANVETLQPKDIVPSGGEVLQDALRHHPRWLTTMTCSPAQHGYLPPSPSTKLGSSKLSSSTTYKNWAGYQVSPTPPPGGAWEAVATWTIPLVSSNSDPVYSTIWPGLGTGSNNTDDELIQAGTGQDIAPGDPQDTYVWFQAYPMQHEQRITNMFPRPLDVVTVDVSYANGMATYLICDKTQNICGQGTQPAPPPGDSAEWIIERPSTNGPDDPWFRELANFGTVHMYPCYYNYDPIQDYYYPLQDGAYPVDMFTGVPENRYLATASPLDYGGAATGFTVTWRDYF